MSKLSREYQMRSFSGRQMTQGEKIFQHCNNVFLVLLGLLCLLPYINLLAKSFSAESYVVAGDILFWPKGFNLDAYKGLVSIPTFSIAFRNSVVTTLLATIIHTFFTVAVGYFTSKEEIPGSKTVMRMYVFTMLFGGGMIPTYMVIKAVGLMNNLWVLVLPGMASTFNVIMARNYFYTVPISLEESAKLDGATNLQVFFRIMLPMAIPSVATITIFTAVGVWNGYMGPKMYLTKNEVKTLSLYLKQIVDASNLSNTAEGAEMLDKVAAASFRAAAIFIATLPILCVYPFLHKYFIVGMKVGAVKE